MSLKYIRGRYGIPAYRGARIEYTASDGEKVQGTITGSAQSARLRVRLDGNKKSLLFHPTFNLVYLKDHPNA